MSTVAAPQSAPKVGGYPIQCPKCQYMTAQVSRLRTHAVNAHHGNLQYQIYVCSECGAVSSDRELLLEHREEVHGTACLAPVLLQKVQMRAANVGANTASLPAVFPAGETQATSDGDPMLPSYRTNMLIPGQRSEPTHHNWSSLIQRLEDRRFRCISCQDNFTGRTEAVFHIVTRHLLPDEIENDLSVHRKLSEEMKEQVRRYFIEGMRTRAGVHYKNADQVESALFLTMDLHLRRLDDEASVKCAECGAVFAEEERGLMHILEKFVHYLPPYMRARSGVWSLMNRKDWVWVVPDQSIGLAVATKDSSVSGREKTKENSTGGSPNKITSNGDQNSQFNEEDEMVGPFDADVASMASKEAQLHKIHLVADNKQFKCSLCPSVEFANERAARTHVVEVHLDTHPALCPLCDFRGDTRAIRAHAARVHHKEDASILYICNPLYFSLWQKVQLK